MAERDFYNGILDADAGDHAARYLYSCYLEERGDKYACAVRWMAVEARCPRGTGSSDWLWYDAEHNWNRDHSGNADLGDEIPRSLFYRTSHWSYAYVNYPTRAAAEAALCEALILEEWED